MHLKHIWLICFLFVSIAAHSVQAADAIPCSSSPTPACLIEQAEHWLEHAGDYDETAPIRRRLANYWLTQGQTTKALEHLGDIDDTLMRATLLIDIAQSVWRGGDHQEATQLFDQAHQHLQSASSNQCQMATRLRYQALLKESALQHPPALVTRHAALPILLDAVRLGLLKQQHYRDDEATQQQFIRAIQTASLKDEASIALIENMLAKQSVNKTQTIIDSIADESIKSEFLNLRLPLILARLGEWHQAAEYTNKINNLTRKTDVFIHIAGIYYDAGKGRRAAHMLEFARDFARKIEDPYERSATFKRIARLYFAMEHVFPARAAFAEAYDATMAIEFLPRKLSALISIMENQKDIGDIKGLRMSAFSAIRSGLFAEIDAYGKPGETNRFLTALDGFITPYDRVEIIARAAPLKSSLLRGRILHKLSTLQYTDRVMQQQAVISLAEAENATNAMTDRLQELRMKTLLAGAALSLAQEEKAERLLTDVQQALKLPITGTIAQAKITREKADIWRLIARELIQVERWKDSLTAYRNSFTVDATPDPHPHLYLTLLIDNQLLSDAFSLFPLPDVTVAAVKGGKTSALMTYLTRIERREDAPDEEQELLQALAALKEANIPGGVYPIITRLKAMDEEKWFWQTKALEKPSDRLMTLMVTSALEAGDMVSALTWMSEWQNKAQKAAMLITAVDFLPKPEESQEEESSSTNAPVRIPDEVITAICAS